MSHNPEVPGAMWMVIKLGQDMATNILMKFGEDLMKTIQVREWTRLIMPIFDKGHYPEVPGAMWLVIEPGQDIMATNIMMKSGEDPMKTIQVREQTKLIRPIFDNSRAIILKCLGRCGWLSNLAKILWPPTFSRNLVKIWWKLNKLDSGQHLWQTDRSKSKCLPHNYVVGDIIILQCPGMLTPLCLGI